MAEPSGRPLAERAQETSGSQIRVMFERANAYEGDLVRLEIGEPDFDTPEFVVDAAAEAARGGATHYTSTYGIPELRTAIAEKLRRDNGMDVTRENVLVTNGGVEALMSTFFSVVNPGDEVVIPTPEWANYASQVRLAGGVPVRVELDPEEEFALDVDAVGEAVGEETAAVILCRPSNPTGRVYEEEPVREVVAAAADHDAYVVADEVYERLTYEGTRRSARAIGDSPENVVSVNSFSKGYAMTGWRLGWLAAHEDVVGAAQTLRQNTSLCSSSLAQRGALAALTGPQDSFDEMVAAYRTRRDVVVERIDEIPHLSCASPQGAFYVFVDVSAFGDPSVDVALRLLGEYGVSTAPGSGFGEAGEGYLRLSYANDLENLRRGLDRIEAMVRDELD